MNTPLLSYSAMYTGLAAIFAVLIVAAVITALLLRLARWKGCQRAKRLLRAGGLYINAEPFTDERSSLEVFKRMFPKEPR